MKKIIASVILACILCFPMMVDAATLTCDGTVKTRYYLVHAAVSAWDNIGASNHGVTIPSSCDSTRPLTECEGTITYNINNEAVFGDFEVNDAYDNEFIISEKKIDNINSNSEITIDKFHEMYMDMLINGDYEKVDPDNDDITYFMHTVDPYKVLMKLDITSKVVQNKIRNSYVSVAAPSFKFNNTTYTPGYHYTDSLITDGFLLEINRSFSITGTDISDCINNDPNGDNPTCIVPSAYVVKYCEAVEETKYTITYDPNGGTGTRKPFTITEGTKHTIISNDNTALKYTREGYDFLGWSKDKTATSATYTVGKPITPTSNMTLYAIWQKIDDSVPTYEVTYHKNAGDDVKNSDPVKQGEDYKIKTGDMYTREGYQFLGWSTDKNATKADTQYNPDSIITLDKKLDLYAIWLNTGSGKVEEDSPKTGLGYSIGLIGTILAGTGAGVVYFKKRNKFENI